MLCMRVNPEGKLTSGPCSCFSNQVDAIDPLKKSERLGANLSKILILLTQIFLGSVICRLCWDLTLNSCFEPRRNQTSFEVYWAAGAGWSSGPFDTQEGVGVGGGGESGLPSVTTYFTFSSPYVKSHWRLLHFSQKVNGPESQRSFLFGSPMGVGQLRSNLVLIWGHRSVCSQLIYSSTPVSLQSGWSEDISLFRLLLNAAF